jgi:hypothetical protein
LPSGASDCQVLRVKWQKFGNQTVPYKLCRNQTVLQWPDCRVSWANNPIRHRIPGIYSAGRCRGEESTRIRICLVPWPKSVTQMADKSPSQDTTNMLPGLFINFLFVCRVHTHPHLSFLLSLVRLHSVEFLSHWDERHNPPALAAVIVPPIGNMPLFYEDGRGRGPEDCIFHRSEIGIRRSEVAYRFWICSPMAKSKLDY